MASLSSKQALNRNWFTISSLVSKDFKLKYRRSILGVAWSVLNPLLMMLVLTAVFSTIFRFSIENYPLYIILGNTLFALMSDSTSSAMYSIIDSSSLIKKVKIEKLIFPIEKVLFQLVNFCISLIAVAIVMAFFRVASSPDLRFAVQPWHWNGTRSSCGVLPRCMPSLERCTDCLDLRHALVLPRRRTPPMDDVFNGV